MFKPKAMGSSKQENTSVYNCSLVQALILQAINALRDKGFGHTRLYSLCTATANGSRTLCQFTNKHLIYYWCPDARKLCVKCHSCEFFNCLDCEILNREISAKARADYLGKLAPREINPLYGSY